MPDINQDVLLDPSLLWRQWRAAQVKMKTDRTMNCRDPEMLACHQDTRSGTIFWAAAQWNQSFVVAKNETQLSLVLCPRADQNRHESFLTKLDISCCVFSLENTRSLKALILPNWRKERIDQTSQTRVKSDGDEGSKHWPWRLLPNIFSRLKTWRLAPAKEEAAADLITPWWIMMDHYMLGWHYILPLEIYGDVGPSPGERKPLQAQVSLLSDLLVPFTLAIVERSKINIQPDDRSNGFGNTSFTNCLNQTDHRKVRAERRCYSSAFTKETPDFLWKPFLGPRLCAVLHTDMQKHTKGTFEARNAQSCGGNNRYNTAIIRQRTCLSLSWQSVAALVVQK